MGKGNGSVSGCAGVTCHSATFGWLHNEVLLVFLLPWLAHGLRDLPALWQVEERGATVSWPDPWSFHSCVFSCPDSQLRVNLPLLFTCQSPGQ